MSLSEGVPVIDSAMKRVGDGYWQRRLEPHNTMTLDKSAEAGVHSP